MALRLARGGGDDDHGTTWLLLPRNIGRYLTPNQARIQCPLDVRNVGALGVRGKGGSRTARPCASRAANPVNEILGHLREIVIHNVGDSFDVNPAGGDIGGYQDPIVAFLEPA